jgi:hypothetical protein
MTNEANEKLAEISAQIEAASYEEDQEGIIAALNSIPMPFWEDSACFLSIIETFFENVKSDMFVYPTEFIPDSFWENEENVRAYVLTLCDYYEKDRIDFNLTGELIPSRILKSKNIVALLLRSNVDETFSYISDEFKTDPEIILAALEGVENKINIREYNSTYWLPPLDPDECLEEFICKIPKSLSSNKDFILDFHDFLAHSSCFCCNELLYKWVDTVLWLDKDFVFEMVSQDHFAISAVSDKDIVFEILSKDNDAIEFVSDELLEDADFTKKIKDELKIDL